MDIYPGEHVWQVRGVTLRLDTPWNPAAAHALGRAYDALLDVGGAMEYHIDEGGVTLISTTCMLRSPRDDTRLVWCTNCAQGRHRIAVIGQRLRFDRPIIESWVVQDHWIYDGLRA